MIVRLMIGLLLLLALAPPALANRCRARCRDQARLCKQRCKITRDGFRARRDCYKPCKLRELSCKTRCR